MSNKLASFLSTYTPGEDNPLHNYVVKDATRFVETELEGGITLISIGLVNTHFCKGLDSEDVEIHESFAAIPIPIMEVDASATDAVSRFPSRLAEAIEMYQLHEGFSLSSIPHMSMMTTVLPLYKASTMASDLNSLAESDRAVAVAFSKHINETDEFRRVVKAVPTMLSFSIEMGKGGNIGREAD